MRKNIYIIVMVWLVLLLSLNIYADTFSSGSTGADGAFNPPSQVPPGTVVDGNVVTVPLPANGIFNFTTFDVPAGTTVKFKRNEANTPVYILTTGDVNIAGIIDVSGENGAPGNTGNIAPVPGGKGGPGGFDGGYGGEPASEGITAKSPGIGLGPGGGSSFNTGGSLCPYASGGSYSTLGIVVDNYGCSGRITPIYGSFLVLPLIGGSGGGGGRYSDTSCSVCYGGGGGGGGGAILIASSSVINIPKIGDTGGRILSHGGIGGSGPSASGGGGGSGGAIKLIANSVIINDYSFIDVGLAGGGAGSGAWRPTAGGWGGTGRIRVEANNILASFYVFGVTPSISTPGLVFLPQVPTLTITTIAGSPVPPTAAGSYTTPDITLPTTTTSPISVEIAASNIPVGTTVKINAVPQRGTSTSATATLAGTLASSTATASLDISLTESSVITAETTFTVQMAMFYEGEKIEKVKIASKAGKKSEVIYITKSGKEIKSEKLFANLK